jgi:hypothetical protein
VARLEQAAGGVGPHHERELERGPHVPEARGEVGVGAGVASPASAQVDLERYQGEEPDQQRDTQAPKPFPGELGCAARPQRVPATDPRDHEQQRHAPGRPEGQEHPAAPAPAIHRPLGGPDHHDRPAATLDGGDRGPTVPAADLDPAPARGQHQGPGLVGLGLGQRPPARREP